MNLKTNSPTRCCGTTVVTTRVRPTRIGRAFANYNFTTNTLTTANNRRARIGTLIDPAKAPNRILVSANIDDDRNAPTHISYSATIQVVLSVNTRTTGFFPVNNRESLPRLCTLTAATTHGNVALVRPANKVSLSGFDIVLGAYLRTKIPHVVPRICDSVVSPSAKCAQPSSMTILLGGIGSLL